MNLAPGWPIDTVDKALRGEQDQDLLDFLKARYNALFFTPLKVLAEESEKRKSDKSHSETQDGYWQFGFAIMSLSCLLIEVLYCYTAGLPSTHRRELEQLHKNIKNIPPEWTVPETEWPSSTAEAFRCFFMQNQRFFPGIDGGIFYRDVRNGLLHQAQTKNGCKIKIEREKLWDGCNLDRKQFAEQLRKYFEHFLEQMQAASWGDPIWRKTARKVWWLVATSKEK